MKIISISLPETALKLVNQWADASGLPPDKFYSNALTLGARIMEISLPPEFVADLTPENLRHVSESANSGVTHKTVLQIITGAKARTLLDDSEQPITEVAVNLPEDLYKKYNETADSIGMQHEKFYLLAFAMGARLSQEGKKR